MNIWSGSGNGPYWATQCCIGIIIIGMYLLKILYTLKLAITCIGVIYGFGPVQPVTLPIWFLGIDEACLGRSLASEEFRLWNVYIWTSRMET